MSFCDDNGAAVLHWVAANKHCRNTSTDTQLLVYIFTLEVILYSSYSTRSIYFRSDTLFIHRIVYTSKYRLYYSLSVTEYRTPNKNKKTSNKKGRLRSQENKKLWTRYTDVSVGRTHSQNKKSSLDQLSCFLFGVRYCILLRYQVLYNNADILHLLVQIMSYANPLYEQCLRTYQLSFVCGVVVFCASFGCDGVGLWADDSPRFSEKKKKCLRENPWGKG